MQEYLVRFDGTIPKMVNKGLKSMSSSKYKMSEVWISARKALQIVDLGLCHTGPGSYFFSYGRKCLKRLRLYGKDARNRGYLAVLFGWVRFSIKNKIFEKFFILKIRALLPSIKAILSVLNWTM